jgi:carboxylesterase type B
VKLPLRLVAVNLHLMLEKPLFSRAIMQSGQARLIGPKTIAFHEKMYSMVLKTLGMDKLSAATRVEKLKTMPLDKIMAVPPPEVMYQPCADGILYKEVPYWHRLWDPQNKTDKPDWVEAVMFGDCKDDGSIDLLFIVTHPDPCADFTKLAYEYLTEHDAKRLLSTYNIPESSVDNTSIWHLCSDYAYNLPVVRAANAWPRPEKCFLYHFERGNTFRTGPPLRGLATHLLDASFLFMNLNENLSEGDRALAREMAARWISFANGEDPWTPYGAQGNAMCMTDQGEFIVRTEKEDRLRGERRWEKWSVVESIGVEKIWKIISVYHAHFDMGEW